MMAYERRKDATKADDKYSYVIVNENDDDCDSDSSDVFMNGPKKGKRGMQFNQRTQVMLCIILVLAIFLLIFVVYNFLTFIFAFQNAVHKFEKQIPLICHTARMLNSEVAKGLKFCVNATVSPLQATNASI